MKVRTFDMLTGGEIECELRGLTISGLATLETPDGKSVVRKLSGCSYDREELKRWFQEG